MRRVRDADDQPLHRVSQRYPESIYACERSLVDFESMEINVDKLLTIHL